MIKTEYYITRIDNEILVKSYSTENKYIKQVETGAKYDIAIDVGVLEDGEYKPKYYTYTETNELIQTSDKS